MGRRGRMGLAAMAAALVALTGAGSAAADTTGIDLLTQADQEIDGAGSPHRASYSLGEGDVSGDGNVDAIIGAPFASGLGRNIAGSVYVLFGTSNPLVDLRTAIGSTPGGGFRIVGQAANDEAGYSAAWVDDVNGDRIGDILLQDLGGDATWVVFGSPSTTQVDLAALGTRGFKINGTTVGAISGAGDVNGDGLADLLVGQAAAGTGGKAFVVFGKSSTTRVNLASLGTGGYEIDGPTGSWAGYAVSKAGDVNHDGTPDAIVGAPKAEFTGTGAGSAYVVFGKANTVPVDLRTLGNSGYRIDGQAGDWAGAAVALAGDVNGDGTKDALIGAPTGGDTATGAAYLVHGKSTPTTVSLGALGHGGYRLDSTLPDLYLGGAVAGAGDFNADGRPDLLIGAELSRPYGRDHAGSAYIVYGQHGTAPVDLTALGSSGLRIDGTTSAEAGLTLAGEGDFDRSPVASRDVLVGAPYTAANGRALSGSVYVIHGVSSLQAHEDDELLDDAAMDSYTHGSHPLRVAPGGQARVAVRAPVIRYRNRRAATVTLRFIRLVDGRRRIGKSPVLPSEGARSPTRCVAATRALRRARSCLRAVTLGRLVRRHSRAGRQRIVFSGRVGNRTLPPGHYLLVATARDSHGGGGQQVVRFTVRR